MLTRRRFSQLLIGSPLLASSRLSSAPSDSPAFPAQDMGAALSQSRDLLIKGGTVIDPSQNLHALLDVAVKDGKILQVAPDIPADGSRSVISAKGKIVTPGLIDVHVHIFEGVGPTGVNVDQYCLGRGVTTAVNAGSAGYFSIAGFRQYVIKPSATRVYAMIDIGARGTLLGMTVDQVIERVTLRPTRMFNFGIELGTLRPGSVADITILDVREGSFVFTDSTGKKRTGRQKLQSTAAIRAGKTYVNRSDDV